MNQRRPGAFHLERGAGLSARSGRDSSRDSGFPDATRLNGREARGFIVAPLVIGMVMVFSGLCGAPAAAAQVAIIAHKTVPIDSVTQIQVLDIYSGEIRRWKNGTPIVAFDLTVEGSVREQFYQYLGRKSSRLKSIWMKNLLMGEGGPPESAKSEPEVLAKVARTPGAIGFVRPEVVDDSVKILAVVPGPGGRD